MFQATVRLHSCCMMTCTLNGGPEVGADREALEARRMPGRQPMQSLPAKGSQQQKFPGKGLPRQLQGSLSCPPLDNYLCVLVTSYVYGCSLLDKCRQSPKSDAKNAKNNKVKIRLNPSGAASQSLGMPVSCP